MVEAVVVVRDGHFSSNELTAEIQACVKTRYGANAHPRRMQNAVALPKTPSGKIQRFKLQQQLREGRITD